MLALVGACKKAPPPECTDLAARVDALAADKSGLAHKRVDAAVAEAKTAMATMDVETCRKSQQAVASASEAVQRAGRAKTEFEKQLAAAQAALKEAREHARNAVGWIDAVPSSPDADPVGPDSKAPADHVDLPGQVRAYVKALDDDENRVTREKDAAALSGYDVAPEVLMSVARALEQRARNGLVLEVEAKKAALAACNPKTEVNGVDALDEFLVMKAPASTLFFAVDPDTHKCRAIHVEKKSLDLGKLSLWKPQRPQPTSVLVGWSQEAVTFVGEGGAFSSFAHPANCAEPTITAAAVEAVCDAAHVRYVWDGTRAVAEP